MTSREGKEKELANETQMKISERECIYAKAKESGKVKVDLPSRNREGRLVVAQWI